MQQSQIISSITSLVKLSFNAALWVLFIIGVDVVHSHEDEKGERIAADLQAVPTTFEPLNVVLGGVHNLYIYGECVYLAHSSSSGISVLDISDPRRPFVSGVWSNSPFSNIVHYIFIRDGMALVSDFDAPNGGLVILNLDNPDNPTILSSIKFSTGLHSAWLADGYVYCNQEFGAWDQLLHIVDVRDPRNPILVNSFRAQGPPATNVLGSHNPFVRAGLLYWAFYDAGLRIFDISDPVKPLQTGYYPTALAWGAHAHDDGLVYVADSIEGLITLRYQPQLSTLVEGKVLMPQVSSLEQNYPNPFNTKQMGLLNSGVC